MRIGNFDSVLFIHNESTNIMVHLDRGYNCASNGIGFEVLGAYCEFRSRTFASKGPFLGLNCE